MAQHLLAQLNANTIKFIDVISYIDRHYTHTPTAFVNGAQKNQATENQGSAKVLSFAKLHELNEQDTLQLFAEHYAKVKATPNEEDHQNIRQFIKTGWKGVSFDGDVLQPRV